MTINSNEKIQEFTLKNNNGMTVNITNFGATITSINVPDKKGHYDNVVLGFKNPEDYKTKGHHHFGGVIGRFANRIKEGKFSLDGKDYTLAQNNGENHLHGGNKGFDKVVWSVDEPPTGNSITFKHVSPDNDEGYPGKLEVKVRYTLNDKNEISIKYEAKSDKATPVNLTNHSYFNLNGGGKGTIANHLIRVNASKYTPVDEGSIPTGIERVEGTELDFKKPKFVGKILNNYSNKQLAIVGGGLDHNFVIDNPSPDKKLHVAAHLIEPESGRLLEVKTTEPGVQVYTGNGLDGGPDNSYQARHTGICLETQHYPDSVNRPEFPSVILEPGKLYSSETVYGFSVQQERSASMRR
jgi:aldose 1-epimerase